MGEREARRVRVGALGRVMNAVLEAADSTDMSKSWTFALDDRSDLEEKLAATEAEAHRLGRVLVGDPIVTESNNDDGTTTWWVTVTIERAVPSAS